MTTFAVTSVSSLFCQASTCLRIGSKFRCIRSTPTEMQAMSENDFGCLASTGVNTPGTMFIYSHLATERRYSKNKVVIPRPTLIGVTLLTLDRPDVRLIFLKRVYVHHPVENYWTEHPTSGVAGFLGGDRSRQSKARMRRQQVSFFVGRRCAFVHVLVPFRDA